MLQQKEQAAVSSHVVADLVRARHERLARSLAAEERKQYDLATKINMLGETRLEQLEIQRQRMDGLFQARTKEIVLGKG